MSTIGVKKMDFGGANKSTEIADSQAESANEPICASEKNLSEEQIEACKLFARYLLICDNDTFGKHDIEMIEKAVIKEMEEKNEIGISYKTMEGISNALYCTAAERDRLRRQLAASRKRQESLAAAAGEEAYQRWKAQQGKGKPKAVIDWEAYDHLRAAKLNAKQIAAALGVSPNTLRVRLKERSGTPSNPPLFDAAREL